MIPTSPPTARLHLQGLVDYLRRLDAFRQHLKIAKFLDKIIPVVYTIFASGMSRQASHLKAFEPSTQSLFLL